MSIDQSSHSKERLSQDDEMPRKWMDLLTADRFPDSKIGSITLLAVNRDRAH
jgi:hypothetical protein